MVEHVAIAPCDRTDWFRTDRLSLHHPALRITSIIGFTPYIRMKTEGPEGGKLDAANLSCYSISNEGFPNGLQNYTLRDEDLAAR